MTAQTVFQPLLVGDCASLLNSRLGGYYRIPIRETSPHDSSYCGFILPIGADRPRGAAMSDGTIGVITANALRSTREVVRVGGSCCTNERKPTLRSGCEEPSHSWGEVELHPPPSPPRYKIRSQPKSVGAFYIRNCERGDVGVPASTTIAVGPLLDCVLDWRLL